MIVAPQRNMSLSGASSFLRQYGVLWVTLALFIGLTLTTDNFLTLGNMRNILDQQSTVLIVACATTLTIIAGGFDVSLSAIFILTPIVAIQAFNATSSVPMAVLAAVATGAAAGLVNGLTITLIRINSLIATLATSFVFFGLAYIVSDRSIVRVIDMEFANFATVRILGFTTATWIAVAVVAVVWVLAARTQFGRYVYATGGNKEAARLAGVPVKLVLASTFVLGGLAAGLSGAINASQSLSAQAADDFSFIFSVIAAVVVGGTSIEGGVGAVWRTIAGVFFIAFLVNGFNLNGVDPIYQRIIQGVVILIAVGVDSWSRSSRK